MLTIIAIILWITTTLETPHLTASFIGQTLYCILDAMIIVGLLAGSSKA